MAGGSAAKAQTGECLIFIERSSPSLDLAMMEMFSLNWILPSAKSPKYLSAVSALLLVIIRWLQDSYLFKISIPEDIITTNGNIDDVILLKYTELIMVVIDNS